MLIWKAMTAMKIILGCNFRIIKISPQFRSIEMKRNSKTEFSKKDLGKQNSISSSVGSVL